MDTEILEREFEPNQIKQRPGRSGQMLDYVETPSVIRRLNEAFDYNWSFEVVSYQVMDNEVVVQGKLTAAGITKMQFGSSQLTKSRQNGALIAIGDDIKAAGSDALKKTATLFGVALHLYSESEAATQTVTNKAEMSGNQGNGTISGDQLAQIKRLRTEMEWAPEKVLDVVERMFGTREIMGINPMMADHLIAHLSNQNGSPPQPHPSSRETSEPPF